MRKGLLKRVLVLLATLAIAVWTFTLPTVIHAATITATGLQSSDATVTDTTGKSVTANFSKWENYQVSYNWAIADGTKIAAGDTATVTLPKGLVASSDLSVALVNKNQKTVGTFAIQSGATSGTITFNDELSSTAINRMGTLAFYTQGTTGSTNVKNDWPINKIGWIAARDANGTPSQLTWNVVFNAASQNVGNVTISDTLGPNQTYVAGSVSATDGAYDANGNFVSDGKQAIPSVTVNGSQLTFTFSGVDTAVNMTYNAKPQITGTSQTWTNGAAISGGITGQVSAQIAWGGNGTGDGDAATTATQPATNAGTNATVAAPTTPANGTTMPTVTTPATSTTGSTTTTMPTAPVTGSITASMPSTPVTGSTMTPSTTGSTITPTTPITGSTVTTTPTAPATSTMTTGTSTATVTPVTPVLPTQPATTGTTGTTMMPSQPVLPGTSTSTTTTPTMPHTSTGTMTQSTTTAPMTGSTTTTGSADTATTGTTQQPAQVTKPATEVGQTAMMQPTTKRLPQTGETTSDLLTVIGLALLIGLSLAIWKRHF